MHTVGVVPFVFIPRDLIGCPALLAAVGYDAALAQLVGTHRMSEVGVVVLAELPLIVPTSGASLVVRNHPHGSGLPVWGVCRGIQSHAGKRMLVVNLSVLEANSDPLTYFKLLKIELVTPGTGLIRKVQGAKLDTVGEHVRRSSKPSFLSLKPTYVLALPKPHACNRAAQGCKPLYTTLSRK